MFAVGKQTAERRRAWARPEYSLNLTPRLRKDGDAGAPLIFYFAAAADKKEKWGPNYTTGDSCSRCPRWTCPPFPGGYASSLERKSAVQQKKQKKRMPGQGRVSVAWLSLTRPFYALHQAEGGNYWNLRQSTRQRRWYELCFFLLFISFGSRNDKVFSRRRPPVLRRNSSSLRSFKTTILPLWRSARVLSSRGMTPPITGE